VTALDCAQGTLDLTDAQGAPCGSPVAQYVLLEGANGGPGFFSDPTCSTDALVIAAPANVTSLPIWVRSGSVGSWQIQASYAGIPSTATVSSVAVPKVVGLDAGLDAGQCSQPFQVELTGAGGGLVSAGQMVDFSLALSAAHANYSSTDLATVYLDRDGGCLVEATASHFAAGASTISLRLMSSRGVGELTVSPEGALLDAGVGAQVSVGGCPHYGLSCSGASDCCAGETCGGQPARCLSAADFPCGSDSDCSVAGATCIPSALTHSNVCSKPSGSACQFLETCSNGKLCCSSLGCSSTCP